MADTIVQIAANNFGTLVESSNPRTRMLWISPDIGYFFYLENGSKIPKYMKTTTGPAGLAAATPVAIGLGQGGNVLSDYGMTVEWELVNEYSLSPVVHIIYTDADDSSIYHKSLNTDTDTLSAQHTVASSLNMAGGPYGQSYSATVTSNGDIYFMFRVYATNAVLRSQDDGASWSAIGSSVPGNIANQTSITNILLPWSLWDGSTEDILLMQQAAVTDDITLFVLDVSTNTWSAGQTVGDDGEYKFTTGTGAPIGAARHPDDGSIFLIGAWETATPDAGIRTFQITSSGQGNITITAKADMIPGLGSDTVDYVGHECQLCLSPKTGKIYAFNKYSPGKDTDWYVGYYLYDITSNTWGSVVKWSDNATTGPFNAIQHCIPTSLGGQICPVSLIASSGWKWAINEASSFEIDGDVPISPTIEFGSLRTNELEIGTGPTSMEWIPS